MRRHRISYEQDDTTFPADAYTLTRGPKVAYSVLGWETEPDEDTEWSGYENRTGRVVVVMVGDDYRHTVDPDELVALDELAYCASCGQIGCSHDGRDREPLEHCSECGCDLHDGNCPEGCKQSSRD